MSSEHRKFDGEKLVVASHNEGKVREIRDLLAPFGLEVVSAGELDLPEPEETGTSYKANAELKALAAAKASGLIALADDSGLSIEALGGSPGIFSARWAGPERDFAKAMELVEKTLQEEGATEPANRSAAFVCALTLAWPDGHMETFEGKVRGTIVPKPRGTNGFGYDPIFRPDGHGITFGEMDPEKKHAISHRAVAFQMLIDACFGK